MEFDLLMTYIPVYISCKFKMLIFYIALVISENVHIAFLYVLSIYWCDHLNMSFMIGDRLTLYLEQYFKIYLFFFCVCNNITILAFKYKNQCVIYRAVMATRFAGRSYKPCPILPLAWALHSLSLLCLYRLAVCKTWNLIQCKHIMS